MTEETMARQVCEPREREKEEVLPGVTLAWDGAFRGEGVPEEGAFEASVRVSADAENREAVTLDDAWLGHATPVPAGRSATGRLGAVEGLPTTLEPGREANFTVRGSYGLAVAGGGKANLHMAAGGRGEESGRRFRLGFNLMLRGGRTA